MQDAFANYLGLFYRLFYVFFAVFDSGEPLLLPLDLGVYLLDDQMQRFQHEVGMSVKLVLEQVLVLANELDVVIQLALQTD